MDNVELEESYRELGLNPDASDGEVKKAWRRLAAQWHPDRNPTPQALNRTQRINRALEQIRQAREAVVAPADHDVASRDPAADIAPIAHPLDVSLEEAALGCLRQVEGTVEDTCPDCSGGGFAHEPATCAACDGAGNVSAPLWFGWLAPMQPCGACAGSGRTSLACPTCAGCGRVTRAYRGQVELPAGLRDAQVVERTVQCGPATRRIALRISLAPHPLFGRDHDGTIRLTVPVDGFDWMAQRWIQIPTPHGLKQMRLQRGALSYRVKGAGLASDDGTLADCMVEVSPLFPAELTRQQSVLLDKLVAFNTGDATSEAGVCMAAWEARVQAWTEHKQ